jgi:hypothetical protein
MTVTLLSPFITWCGIMKVRILGSKVSGVAMVLAIALLLPGKKSFIA